MVTKIHIIPVGVKSGINLQNEIKKVMGNLKENIEINKGEFVEFVTNQTKYVAKLETQRFRFLGDLEKGITSRIYKKSNRGEVFVIGDQQKKAQWMEEGVKEHRVKNQGKINQWVRKKAPHLTNNEWIRVGSPRGNIPLGKSKNKFWGVTRQIIENDIDKMFAHYIEKAIEKS